MSFARVPGAPFGVAITPDGRYAFVDLFAGRVLVYSLVNDRPTLARTIALPGNGVEGCSITRDGRLLLVADGQGAAVVSVSRAERGLAHPVLGMLSPPHTSHVRATEAIETASSADGRYVFVSMEYGNPDGAVAVYDLGGGQAPRLGSAGYVGSITLGQAVVGSAVSPNGRYLYVTSELADQTRSQADGTLSIIDISRAERAAQHPVLASVKAGHQPVRVAVSPSGATVWVTARADNRVLAFAADRLLSDPAKALEAEVSVGTAPVGLATFDDGNRLLIADSNRFDARGAHAGLSVLDTQAALAHRPATVAGPPAGVFPREIAVDDRDGIALVTDFGSEQLETIQLNRFL